MSRSKQSQSQQQTLTNLQKVNQRLNSLQQSIQGKKKNSKKNSKKKIGGQARFSDARGANQLSPCAMKYALAIADPWNPQAAQACVPSFPARPSQKVPAFTRFTMTVGSAGYGFVLICPSLANDGTLAWFSGSTFAGTSPTFVVTGTGSTSTTGVQTAAISSQPYSTSQFDAAFGADTNNGIKGRMVCVGASIQATGSLQTTAGMYSNYVDPWHGNCYGMTTANIGSKREAIVTPINRSKHWLQTSASVTGETEYSTAAFYAATSTTNAILDEIYPFSDGNYLETVSSTNSYTNGACPMIFTVSGAPAGFSFEVEIIIHGEFIGGVTQAVLSPSHADVVGFQAVNAASQKLAGVMGSKDDPSSMKKSMFQLVNESLQELTGSAARGFGQAIMGNLGAPNHGTRSNSFNPYRIEN